MKIIGEPWREEFFDKFGLASADCVVDMYNNGGLILKHEDTGENVSVSFVAQCGDEVKIGCWIWYEGEDFDTDAEWLVLKDEDFTESELNEIYAKMEEIYGKRELKKIAAYCREQIEDYDLRVKLALNVMDRMRCPLQMADDLLYTEIYNCACDWADDNGYSVDFFDGIDVEEIIFAED